MEVFCSTIIPTVNRPTLSCTVGSVLDQTFTSAAFEIIVVNDSGQPLPDVDWRHSERVQVIHTNRRERSVARNTGAAIATGKYLHFLDDDDLLLPGALEAFWRLDKEVNDAAWLYGSYQTVDNDGNLVEEFHPGITGNISALLVAGESIPLPASLLQTNAFFAAGGFDPNLSYAEDRDLGRRISLSGDVAWISAVVARLRVGEVGSTSDWSKKAANDRWGREKALRLINTFARLSASANSSYWRGRVSRAYFASMVWNLKRKNIFTAASRATAGLAFAGWSTLSPEFWHGLRTKTQ
jgi:glycosyltransferase involved in cell wall biosynthesis